MKLDYITFRDVGNAGDNLIGYALQGLVNRYFGEEIDYNVCHLARDSYAEKCQDRNILFGPGGIVTGSPDKNDRDRLFMRHISHELLADWRANNKNVFFFGSGTNSSSLNRAFTDVSGKLLGDLVSTTRYMYLRGHADIEVLEKFVEPQKRYKMRFQPCPSMFLDKIYGIKPKKKDRVAINLNFGTLSEEEVKVHPIRRFVDYVRSEGLTPVLWANHHIDIADGLHDVFQGQSIYNSPKYNPADVRRTRRSNKKSPFKNRMHQGKDLARDFNGFRFAFGKRLHGYLPFSSFGAVPVFLSTRAVRKRIPGDYFGLPELSVPFEPGNPDGSVDRMIETLKYMIKNEAELGQRIAESRHKLLRLTKDNLYEMRDIMQS